MSLQLVTSMQGKFKGAGSVVLKRLSADGTPSKVPKDIYILNKTGMSVINASWSPQTEEFRDENHYDPIHIYKTGKTQTVGVASLVEDPYFDLYLKGGEVKVESDGKLLIPDILATIPKDGIYEFEAPEGAETPKLDETEPILVRDIVTGEYYTRTDSTVAPKTGEFRVDTAGGEIQFSEDDADKTVYITATFEAGRVTRFEYDNELSGGSFELVLAGWFQQYNETNLEYINETYPAVTLASGELASMARQLSPSGTKTYTFQSTAAKSGKKFQRITGQPPVVDI